MTKAVEGAPCQGPGPAGAEKHPQKAELGRAGDRLPLQDPHSVTSPQRSLEGLLPHLVTWSLGVKSSLASPAL